MFKLFTKKKKVIVSNTLTIACNKNCEYNPTGFCANQQVRQNYQEAISTYHRVYRPYVTEIVVVGECTNYIEKNDLPDGEALFQAGLRRALGGRP
jgi:hypothetical protein